MRNRLNLTVLLMCMTSMGFGSVSGVADESVAAKLRVAVVQMRSSRDLQANVQRTKEHLEVCKNQGVQIVVFPECSRSGYFEDYISTLTAAQLESAIQAVASTCRELSICAVVGSPTRHDNRLHNSAIVINEQGKIVERYHKIQLATLGCQ